MYEQHIPTQRALLAWQHPVKEGNRRMRHALAELVQKSDGVSFRYLDDDLLCAARQEGFKYYPGLPPESDELDKIALDVLMWRLPPRFRSRSYKDLLRRYGLSTEREFSPLSLLAYTGARMTSDSYSVCETFDGFNVPFSYVLDVAGFRHYALSSELIPDERMVFVREPGNVYDRNAVRIDCEDGATVWYVNRLQAIAVGKWLDESGISASIFHSNERLPCPRLFVRAEVVPQVGADASRDRDA